MVESPTEAPLLQKGYSSEINDGVAEPVPYDMAWKYAALGKNTKWMVNMCLIKGSSRVCCDYSKMIRDAISLQFTRTLYAATESQKPGGITYV